MKTGNNNTIKCNLNENRENDPLVSIIIPVFNVAPYLPEALNSVIHQTYEKLEILIIEDGSTDGSDIICDEYAKRDKRIKVIHQENRGLSAARNTGLDIMTGEVVAFLDADDAFYTDFIRVLVFTMIRDESDIVICKCIVQKTTGVLNHDIIGETKPTINEGKYDRIGILHAIAKGMINNSVWNKIYRRELWRDVRFNDGHVYEDTDATLGVFDICKSVSVLDQPLYAHRKRPGSITTNKSCTNVRDWLLAHYHKVLIIEDRTPEVFTQEMLNKSYESWLVEMIGTYIHFSWRKNHEADQFIRELRNMIVAAGKESNKVRIKDCMVRTRLLYRIICSCPCLLTVIYPLLHAKRMVFGKPLGSDVPTNSLHTV